MRDINHELIHEVKELEKLIEYIFSKMQHHQDDLEKNDVYEFF